MKLDIREPSYYNKYHLLDKEIFEMYDAIKNFAKGKEYSEIVQTVDIVPIVAPPEVTA